jgi:uncharacterized protein (DUF1330 family)
MAVYAIFNYDVADTDGYQQYQKAAGGSFAGRAFKVLALDPATTRVEGERSGMQTVILEFDTKEAFDDWYNSPEYQAAVGTRLAATTNGVGLLVAGR